MLSMEHTTQLEARGLDPELVASLGITSDGEWLKIPYYDAAGVAVNHKYRTLGGEKRFRQDGGAVKCFWNIRAITDPTLADRPLICCEGELDAIAAMQAGFARVVSVPDGAPSEAIGEAEGAKYSYVADAAAILRDVKEIVLATDNDGPGINLMNDLAIRLHKHRCKWVRYPVGCKDLNDALLKYGQRGVVETLNRAQWMRVDGVYRMSELPPVNNPPANDIGIHGLAPHYKIRLGDFTVITGIPSHGKSSFANEVMGRMASAPYNWNVAVASFEQMPQIDFKRNLRTFYHGIPAYFQQPDDLAKADEWIDNQFSFLVPNEDDDVDLKWVLERAQAAIVQNGAKLVVIDPWNEMDHIRPADMSLTEYTGYAIKQFRKLARRYCVHVIVVAHPTKLRPVKPGEAIPPPTLYDISDSAHWANKADVGIVIHKKEDNHTLIRISKSRYHEIIGKPGEIEALYSRDRGRYEVL